MSDTIAARLLLVRQTSQLSQRNFSRHSGVAFRTWQTIEAGGNVPSGETLLKLSALGWNPGWILTGRGPMRLDDPAGATPAGVGSPATPLDAELLGGIIETIIHEAQAAGVSIPPAELGRKAGKTYAELMAASSDPAERRAMLKLTAVQLRRELRESLPSGAPSPRKDPA